MRKQTMKVLHKEQRKTVFAMLVFLTRYIGLNKELTFSNTFAVYCCGKVFILSVLGGGELHVIQILMCPLSLS